MANNDNNHEFVLESLKTKYEKEFKVNSSQYLSSLGKVKARVSPLDNEAIDFEVEYTKDGSFIRDFYVERLHNWQAMELTRSYLSSIKIPNVFVVIGRYSGNVDPKNIPSFKDLINAQPQQITLVPTIYFFANSINQVLPKVIELDQSLRTKDLQKAGFSIVVYDASKVDTNNLDQYDFGFKRIGDDTFEWKNENAALGRLNYYINPDVKESPTEADLQSILVDDPFNSMFNKL